MVIEEKFKGKIVYLDSAPLIYYIEKNEKYFNKVERVFKSFDEGNFIFITSVITITEVLTLPHSSEKVNELYDYFFGNSSPLTILPISTEEARLAATIRKTYKLKTPDAIHFATASSYRSDYFFTNDSDFKKILQIPIVIL